jgi:L-asparaginase
MSNGRTHRVLLITTGGTIAGQVAVKPNDTDGVSAADLTREADEFAQLLADTTDYVGRSTHRTIEVETYRTDDGQPFCNIDSSDVKPKHWTDLAQLVYDKFDSYDSFIITHGTNTLGYTCAALAFAIANSGKPIVLTGSQVPAGHPGTDALTNLQNALRVAVWEPRRGSNDWMQGVMAVFGSFIITGTRVKKDTEFDYDAFKSFSVGSIGRIGRIIHINPANLGRHRSYLTTSAYPIANHQRELELSNSFDMSIASLTEFPGMDPQIFETLVSKGAKGFVLRAFGAGDPSTDLQDAFTFLKDRRIPIVVTTQAPNGNSNFQVNEPGQWLRNNNMAIPAYDMSIESQTTKLAWLIARGAPYEQVCKEMVQDVRGEVNPIWEMD